MALRGVGAAPDGERKQVFVCLRVCYTFCSYFVRKILSVSVFVQLDRFFMSLFVSLIWWIILNLMNSATHKQTENNTHSLTGDLADHLRHGLIFGDKRIWVSALNGPSLPVNQLLMVQ